MFLLVEQTVTYARPIMPFQSYKIQTSIKVCSEDKWVYYTHIFEEANPSSSGPPKQYARIDAKTVMKLSNGKTLKPSEVSAINPFYKALVETKWKDRKTTVLYTAYFNAVTGGRQDINKTNIMNI